MSEFVDPATVVLPDLAWSIQNVERTPCFCENARQQGKQMCGRCERLTMLKAHMARRVKS